MQKNYSGYIKMNANTLANPSNTAAILQKHGFRFQKKYGQNFLIDTHILEKIVSAADITSKDYVIEIGPGIGTLTQYLAGEAGKVIAVEIDKKLIPILNETLSDYHNIEVINEDILKVDLNELLAKSGFIKGTHTLKVVANLPYYITTPIVMGLLEQHIPLESITIMVQKEVALRMQAQPGNKDYGALSLAIGYYAKAEIVTKVPCNCFVPKPNVDSIVIRLTKHNNPPVEAEDEDFLFKLIRASFNQRRKTLVNGLSNAQNLNISKDSIVEVLGEMGISEVIRGEALTLHQFAQLSNKLVKYSR